ncbi:MAG: matrixin family metalloprotease [Oligoflexus sp.]
MRISLKVLLILCVSMQMACGDMSERRHIDEGPVLQSQAVSSSSPFHSLNGWQAPVTFFVEASSPDQIVEASIIAAASWSDAVGYTIISFEGVIEAERGHELYSSLNDDKTIIYYETDWLNTTGKPATTLATTVWENDRQSDQIVRGDVILNAEVYLFQDALQPAEDDSRKNQIVDGETVILHEFGHLLGLDHVMENEDEESIMHAKTFIGPYMHSRVLSDGDRLNIRSIYD